MSVSVPSRSPYGSTDFSNTQKDRRPDRSAACGVTQHAAVRRLDKGEVLFAAGDPRTHFYRVESGCICVYAPHNAEHRAIEFVFAGDLLGLGNLENHIRSARAISETRVSCLPLKALDLIVEASPRARDQLNRATDAELEFVRDGLVTSGQRNPIERVAAFLVALSHGNSYEGRNPNIITETLTCGVVAGDLALSVEGFAHILGELEERGLIERCPQGLRLNDIAALERLADGRETPALHTQPTDP